VCVGLHGAGQAPVRQGPAPVLQPGVQLPAPRGVFAAPRPGPAQPGAQALSPRQQLCQQGRPEPSLVGPAHLGTVVSRYTYRGGRTCQEDQSYEL